jgi:cell division protein FtsB
LAARGHRGRLWKVVAVVALLAAWATVFLAGDGGWLDLRRDRERLARLESEVASLEAQNDSLRLVLERMASDPDFLERVAREELGMIRTGEYLYRIKRLPEDGE